VLPAPCRMRRSEDFARTVRHGRRAGRPLLVVHVLPAMSPDEAEPPLVGLVVSRAVGPAVTRTRVKRRLRHQLSARLGTLAPGMRLVVRANPAAASATSQELGADLDRALRRARSLEGAGAGAARSGASS